MAGEHGCAASPGVGVGTPRSRDEMGECGEGSYSAQRGKMCRFILDFWGGGVVLGCLITCFYGLLASPIEFSSFIEIFNSAQGPNG
jgi:hypothetical protein